ncbi:hypothetical protein RB653_007729 [Dictyostelium firmibasis]|uniref:Uncharacterized protein n=1 Tax=Dictyostelium firmibasis TaxID=79012 RepID=A0AAN7U1P7_9MYCE
MDEHIIRLYDINGREAIQINGRWLDCLGYGDLATQADSLGIAQAFTHSPKIQLYNKVLSLVKETRDESEEPVDLIPCDCLLCLKGLPKTFRSGDGKTIQIWEERLKIIIFIIISQQNKHAKELENELQERGFKKNSDIKKVLGTKRSYVHSNEILYFLETHSSLLNINLDENWKATLPTSKEFISGFDKFNLKGYWTLSSFDDPFSSSYNFSSNSNATLPIKKKKNVDNNNNNIDIINVDNNNDQLTYISSKKACGGITKSGKPCAKIGFCSYHMIRRADNTFEMSPSLNNINSDDSDEDIDTDSGSDEYESVDGEKDKKRTRSNSFQNDKSNKKQDHKQLKNYISEKTFKLRELEKKILDNFNFYRFIVKFEQYGYRLPREFVRFIALKVICDKTGETNDSTILQPPKLVEEFWIQVILTSLEYNKLLQIINVEKIRYDPDLLFDETSIQRKRYEKTIKLYKKYFKFDKFDSEIWKENYLLE